MQIVYESDKEEEKANGENEEEKEDPNKQQKAKKVNCLRLSLQAATDAEVPVGKSKLIK